MYIYVNVAVVVPVTMAAADYVCVCSSSGTGDYVCVCSSSGTGDYACSRPDDASAAAAAALFPTAPPVQPPTCLE
jgi:hypothetical protein